MMDGSFKLTDGVFDMGVAGIGLAQTLGCGVRFVEPLQLYAPKRNSSIILSVPMKHLTSNTFSYRVFLWCKC